MVAYENYVEKRSKNPDRLSIDPETAPQVAQAYATIALAEAATRQAAALERIAAALHYTNFEGKERTIADAVEAIAAAQY